MVYKRFDIPTQVIFWDFDEEKWTAGIAFGDIVICGCCGGIFDLYEINSSAPEEIENPVRPQSWVDLTEEIAGDEWPENSFEVKPIEAEYVREERWTNYGFLGLLDPS